MNAVRQQCNRVYDLAKQDGLEHFKLDESKIAKAVQVTEETIRKAYPDLKVPYHSRLRHFESAAMAQMMEGWRCDKVEKARRMVDLLTVSVLLDAGAGSTWRYLSQHGQSVGSSEGLAL